MSFRLHPNESITKGIRRVLLAQVDAAAKRLAQQGCEPEDIHEARKCFKRVRATLRLVRAGIGEAAFKRENAAFREIAGLLAGARDRHVLLQTVLKLESSGSDGSKTDDAPAATLAALKKALHTPQDQTAADSISRSRTANARHALDAARKRLRRLRIEPDSIVCVAEGLRRTQRDMIAGKDEALRKQSDATFHDWRKAVQWHWRHMKLLATAWPAYFEARAATARELSQVLGDDHDLSMLIAFAADRKRSGLSTRMAREVTAACRIRQTELRATATTLGARIAADQPKSLARHVAALWNVAADSQAATSADGASDDESSD